MATSLKFRKLVSSDISSGSSFVVNKLASGNTASAIVVFDPLTANSDISAYYFKIGSVKVGGQNILNEEINIKYEIGYYIDKGQHDDDMVGFYSNIDAANDTVSEKDKTTSSTASLTYGSGNYSYHSNSYCPAYRITVSSTMSSRGAEVVMSDFQLSVDIADSWWYLSGIVSPTKTGSISGLGQVKCSNPTTTLTATPNAGYRFVKWQDGNTQNPRTITVTGDATYTAYFEVDKINKIFIDTVKPKKILIDNQEVKAIFVDTTKVYG